MLQIVFMGAVEPEPRLDPQFLPLLFSALTGACNTT